MTPLIPRSVRADSEERARSGARLAFTVSILGCLISLTSLVGCGSAPGGVARPTSSTAESGSGDTRAVARYFLALASVGERDDGDLVAYSAPNSVARDFAAVVSALAAGGDLAFTREQMVEIDGDSVDLCEVDVPDACTRFTDVQVEDGRVSEFGRNGVADLRGLVTAGGDPVTTEGVTYTPIGMVSLSSDGDDIHLAYRVENGLDEEYHPFGTQYTDRSGRRAQDVDEGETGSTAPGAGGVPARGEAVVAVALDSLDAPVEVGGIAVLRGLIGGDVRRELSATVEFPPPSGSADPIAPTTTVPLGLPEREVVRDGPPASVPPDALNVSSDLQEVVPGEIPADVGAWLVVPAGSTAFDWSQSDRGYEAAFEVPMGELETVGFYQELLEYQGVPERDVGGYPVYEFYLVVRDDVGGWSVTYSILRTGQIPVQLTISVLPAVGGM